jgi:hypothetical protein
VKQILTKNYGMDDRGKQRWFLGIDFQKRAHGFTMSRERYVKNVHEKFNMPICNPVSTLAVQGLALKKPNTAKSIVYPNRGAVGILIYLMSGTRPDISWITSKLSQFASYYDEMHEAALRCMFRYLQGTQSSELIFVKKTIVIN